MRNAARMWGILRSGTANSLKHASFPAQKATSYIMAVKGPLNRVALPVAIKFSERVLKPTIAEIRWFCKEFYETFELVFNIKEHYGRANYAYFIMAFYLYLYLSRKRFKRSLKRWIDGPREWKENKKKVKKEEELKKKEEEETKKTQVTADGARSVCPSSALFSCGK